MKLFQCQNCGQPLYFENTRCERCGLALGYLSEQATITALKPDGNAPNAQQQVWRALADNEFLSLLRERRLRRLQLARARIEPG